MSTHTEQLYRALELAKLLGVSRTTIWRSLRLGALPKPIKPFPRVTAWRKSDIDAWLATKSEGGAK
jgi:prophage regulatory protein